MKIAFVIPTRHNGGAEFTAMQWAKELVAGGGCEVAVVTTHEAVSAANREIPGVRHVRLGGKATFLGRIQALRRLIRVEKFDIVMGLMPHWNVLVLLATRGSLPRAVISSRAIATSPRGTIGLKNRLELLLAKVLYRRADAYVAISHPVAAEAIAAFHVKQSMLWVVANPATGKIDPAVAREQRQIRNAVDRSREIALVLPARIVEQKRPLLALEVAREISDRLDNSVRVAVHYYGRGPLEELVAQAADSLGVEAVFHGWVERWFDHVPDTAILLLPSRSEGFGNVLIESAAYGVPSVASSRALGVADGILPGVTGALAASDSPADLASAVLDAHVMRVPVDLELWLDRFSPRASALALRAVFQRVL